MLQSIKQRRSIREFTSEPVSQIDVMTILEAGSWAPSAKNNQPWKFVIVEEPGVLALLGDLTIYSTIIAQCKVLIVVYLDSSVMLEDWLDLQSAGAAIQNMLLTTDSLGLGGVWLGDIACAGTGSVPSWEYRRSISLRPWSLSDILHIGIRNHTGKP